MSIFTSILTGGDNNHETTAEYANGAQTDLIGEGVVGTITNTGGVAPATGAFAVNAQGTPAMAVDVSSGVAYVTATPTGQNSQNLRIRSTATEEVVISANSTGSTKYDWIYLSVSATNAANPAVNGDNVTTLVTSRSTSSASDDGTPPTYGILLAKVTVANGASSITNANITDARNNITVPVASVDTAQIVAGAVDTTQLADGAVTEDKLDSTVSWWTEIGRTTLASAGDTLTVSSLPARKYLMIRVDVINSGQNDLVMTFNSDSGNNYTYDAQTSASFIALDAGAPSEPQFFTMEIINVAARTKRGYYRAVREGAGAAASNVAVERTGFFKWANTTNAITSITITNSDTGDLAIGSELVVMGHD